jgi:hypothetical protein
VLKECFWDMHVSNKDIDAMLVNEEFEQKAFLFDKMLCNSTKLFKDLDLFEKKDLKKLLQEYQVPKFNQAYLLRRKNLAEVYFFDCPLQIDELQWVS